MIGIGIARRLRSNVSLRLGSLWTLTNTLTGSTAQKAAAVDGFTSRYKAQRDWLAARGVTIPAEPVGTPADVFAAIETVLRQARAAAEAPANTLTYQGQALTYHGQPLTYGASA